MTEKEVEDDSQSPGFQFSILFQSMHDLNDKLLTINYSKQFAQKYKCPPINRYYFCRQSNPAQQFYTFCCLSAFILNKLNPNIIINAEDFDEPNVTIDSIIDNSKDFVDINNYSNNRNKLRHGYGQEIINLLNELLNKLIECDIDLNDNKGVVIKGSDDSSDEDINEDMNADEVNATELEEEQNEYIFIDDKPEADEEEDEIDRRDDNIILKSDCDINEWKTEVERVLPQLKVKMINKNTDNEWRHHYNSVSLNYNNMKTLCELTFGSIQILHNELRSNDDKITSREKYLRQQFEHILEEWISIRTKVIKMRDEYSHVSSGVVMKSSQLADISQSIDSMKQEMEMFSNKMTDSSPLMVAKRAKESIKQELNAIELRIGVSIQTLINNHKY